MHRRPDPIRARLRSLLLLGLFGLGVLRTTALSGLVAVGERFGPGLRIGAPSSWPLSRHVHRGTNEGATAFGRAAGALRAVVQYPYAASTRNSSR